MNKHISKVRNKMNMKIKEKKTSQPELRNLLNVLAENYKLKSY